MKINVEVDTLLELFGTSGTMMMTRKAKEDINLAFEELIENFANVCQLAHAKGVSIPSQIMLHNNNDDRI